MSRLTKAALVAAMGMIGIAGVVASRGQAQPAPAAKPESQCFYSRNINGFNAPDDRTLYIRVGVNEIYRLDLMNDCNGLTFRQDIALSDEPAGDAFICSPIQATVTYREAGIRERCPVTAMHRLTPAEIAAVPKKFLP